MGKEMPTPSLESRKLTPMSAASTVAVAKVAAMPYTHSPYSRSSQCSILPEASLSPLREGPPEREAMGKSKCDRNGAAVRGANNSRNVCRHFSNGSCNRGSSCRFYHPGSMHRVVFPDRSLKPKQMPITPLKDLAEQEKQNRTDQFRLVLSPLLAPSHGGNFCLGCTSDSFQADATSDIATTTPFVMSPMASPSQGMAMHLFSTQRHSPSIVIPFFATDVGGVTVKQLDQPPDQSFSTEGISRGYCTVVSEEGLSNPRTPSSVCSYTTLSRRADGAPPTSANANLSPKLLKNASKEAPIPTATTASSPRGYAAPAGSFFGHPLPSYFAAVEGLPK